MEKVPESFEWKKHQRQQPTGEGPFRKDVQRKIVLCFFISKGKRNSAEVKQTHFTFFCTAIARTSDENVK